MDLMKMGAQLLMSKMSGGDGNGMDLSSVMQLLGSMTPGDSSDLNLQGLVGMFQEKGLGSIVESWLGDGDNEAVSPEQLKEVVGSDKIAELAQQFGGDEDSLLGGLSEALPQLVDKSSSGGSLLDSVGGIEGALGMAKKFFG
ncbi:MAG: YidB family protein [bacterium]